MPSDIFVVGCEFHENSLIDKKVDIVFSNPPYSEYREWATKIINQANAKEIFLVIPERWKNCKEILEAIEDRKASYKVIGNADFLDAERKARAVVDIIKIKLQSYSYNYSTPDVDPFKLWASQEFPINKKEKTETTEQFHEKVNSLVPGRGIVPVLVELYNNEMMILHDNFKSISRLDQNIFSELNINFTAITDFLENRIKGLKEKYWRELFNNFKPITSRLTTDSRKSLLETLTSNMSVDFIESNIYAVATWTIKNANKYFDTQLIDVFTDLAKKANCVKYKSNQNTWGNDDWRFREYMRDGKITNFGLDYRCVIEGWKCFNESSYGDYEYPNGLYKNVHDRINNILTIGHNLGFCSSTSTSDFEWEPGKTIDFKSNDDKIMLSVKCYKNGNIHVKFNQLFLKTLNVEFGRLKGWLRSTKQAAYELGIPESEVLKCFNSNYMLDSSNIKLLS